MPTGVFPFSGKESPQFSAAEERTGIETEETGVSGAAERKTGAAFRSARQVKWDRTEPKRKAEQKKAAAIPAFFRIRRERGERERIKSPSRTF